MNLRLALAVGMLVAAPLSAGAQALVRTQAGRTRVACAEARAPIARAPGGKLASLAIRLHVRESESAIAVQDLDRIAQAVVRKLAANGYPPARRGAFAVVLDDVGGPHFFTWLRPPRDSVGARAVELLMNRTHPRYGEHIVPSVPAAPLALEIRLDSTCR